MTTQEVTAPTSSQSADESAGRRIEQALFYINEWLGYQAWQYRVPGMQVAIRFGGELKASWAYGVTNEDTQEPVTTRHLFRVASQSKTITATAVMQLVEKGVLRLDDPVGDHVAELVEAGSPMATLLIRDVLGHTAGIVRDGWAADANQLLKPHPDEKEVLRILIEEGKVLEPSVALKYSNVGYNLLGLIISRVSGLPYNEYVAKYIVEPLGLQNTGPDLDPSREAEFVHGHSGLHTTRSRTVLPLVATLAGSPSGGFYSTAEDLTTYYSAHLMSDTRLISDTSKRLQQHPRWTSDPTNPGAAYYALGFQVESFAGYSLFGHSGGHPGGQTSISFVDARTGLIVSLVSNAIDAPVEMIGKGILRLLLAATVEPSDPSGPGINPALVPAGSLVESTDSELAQFTGRFSFAWGVADFVALGGKLVMLTPQTPDPLGMVQRLIMLGDDELQIVGGSGWSNPGERIHVVRSEDGTIQRLEGRGGQTMSPAPALELP